MTPQATRLSIALSCCVLLAAGLLHGGSDAGSDAGPDARAQEPPAGGTTEPVEREPLRLRYLANEGFLVEVGDDAVLFDAFLAMPYAGYPSMPAKLVDQLRSAEGPFSGVDLALTSHAHADHFQERVARDFLLASPDTHFSTTKQVIAVLKGVTDESDDLEARLHPHYPKAEKVEKQTFGDLEVRYLRVPHGGMPDVENLGTLLTIGGHVVLHLGDADVDRSIFEPYADELKKVDVALVPHWFHTSKKGREIVADYLPARTHVAMHFAKRRLAEVVESFLENHDGVHAFSEPLQEATFE